MMIDYLQIWYVQVFNCPSQHTKVTPGMRTSNVFWKGPTTCILVPRHVIVHINKKIVEGVRKICVSPLALRMVGGGMSKCCSLCSDSLAIGWGSVVLLCWGCVEETRPEVRHHGRRASPVEQRTKAGSGDTRVWPRDGHVGWSRKPPLCSHNLESTNGGIYEVGRPGSTS